MGKRAVTLGTLGTALTIVACQPQLPLAGPSGSPVSGLPVSQSPTAVASPTATPTASSQPLPSPSPDASATPAPSPTAAPLAGIKGVVQNDNGTPLVGFTVRVESVATGALLKEVVTDGIGAYSVAGVPLGDTWKVSVQGQGYGLRQGLVSIPAAADTATVYTQSFTGNMALTLKPEVIDFQAAPSTAAVAPLGELTVNFSAPMDKNSVSSAFCIQLDSPSSLQTLVGAILPAGVVPASTANVLMNSGDFDIAWPTPSRAIFKPSRPWPTTPSGAVPKLRMLMQFNGQRIRDNVGQEARDTTATDDATLKSGPFFLTNRPDPYVSFTPATDSDTLRLTSGTASHSATTGGTVKLVFSRTLRRELLNGVVLAGGAGGNAAQAAAAVGQVTAAQAAANYEVKVNNGAFQSLAGFTGARADVDYADPTLASVRLTVPLQPAAVFQPGDSITVRVKSAITDFAGNLLGTGDSNTSVTMPVI